MAEISKPIAGPKQNDQVDRRQFIASAGAAALSLTVVKPEQVRGTQGNSRLKFGLIGCGERGTWITDYFRQHGGYEIVAGADYFQDRVDAFGDKYQVPAAGRYTGLSAYRRLLDQGVDVVAIESPPYFHPEQAAAAVDAGCHVYLCKPVAVDVPGCQTIAESGKKATAKQRCFLVDFQTRAHPIFREALKRVHYGDIGRLVSGVGSYDSDSLPLKVEPSDSGESRLRNWQFVQALSGDNIVEGNIHTIDIACWIMDGHPIEAYGAGGRKVSRDPYDNWDYFDVTYLYPDNVPFSFTGTQFKSGWSSIHCHVFGERGMIDTNYFGDVHIYGEMAYRGGSTGSIYDGGVITNIAEFYDNISKDRYANTTVAPSVTSTLTAILGRNAAYRRGELTWNDMIKTNEKLDPRLTGLKS